MFIKVEKEKLNKIHSISNILSRNGKLIAECSDRDIYEYKNKIWELHYRQYYQRTKIINDCLLEAKDWDDLLPSEKDDNRFSTKNIIKAIYKVRPVIKKRIESITWNVPDFGHPDALSAGLRFNNTYGIFLNIRRGYYKDFDDLDEIAEKAVLNAANLDWYYENEHEC